MSCPPSLSTPPPPHSAAVHPWRPPRSQPSHSVVLASSTIAIHPSSVADRPACASDPKPSSQRPAPPPLTPASTAVAAVDASSAVYSSIPPTLIQPTRPIPRRRHHCLCTTTAPSPIPPILNSLRRCHSLPPPLQSPRCWCSLPPSRLPLPLPLLPPPPRPQSPHPSSSPRAQYAAVATAASAPLLPAP